MTIDDFFEIKKQDIFDTDRSTITLTMWRGNKSGEQYFIENVYIKNPVTTRAFGPDSNLYQRVNYQNINNNLVYSLYENRKMMYESQVK
jgi:hypothetical protein